MLVLVNVENSGLPLGRDKHVSKQFTSDNYSKPIARSGYDFLGRPSVHWGSRNRHRDDRLRTNPHKPHGDEHK